MIKTIASIFVTVFGLSSICYSGVIATNDLIYGFDVFRLAPYVFIGGLIITVIGIMLVFMSIDQY